MFECCIVCQFGVELSSHSELGIPLSSMMPTASPLSCVQANTAYSAPMTDASHAAYDAALAHSSSSDFSHSAFSLLSFNVLHTFPPVPAAQLTGASTAAVTSQQTDPAIQPERALLFQHRAHGWSPALSFASACDAHSSDASHGCSSLLPCSGISRFSATCPTSYFMPSLLETNLCYRHNRNLSLQLYHIAQLFPQMDNTATQLNSSLRDPAAFCQTRFSTQTVTGVNVHYESDQRDLHSSVMYSNDGTVFGFNMCKAFSKRTEAVAVRTCCSPHLLYRLYLNSHLIFRDMCCSLAVTT